MNELGVDVGDRLYQVPPTDALWGSNPATLRAMTMHYCCSELGNPLLLLLYAAWHCSVEKSPSVSQ